MARGSESLLDRFVGACFAVLAAAVAIYVAVKLIESVAAAVLVLVAAAGGLLLTASVVRALWHRRRMDRW